ncbi:helix-turn-helix domain-containing protein [bacterium]|nr:helix-turn-helix domain-containing protein [bacterium]
MNSTIFPSIYRNLTIYPRLLYIAATFGISPLNLINPYKLTDIGSLTSLVEHRTKFSLDFCELNLFETRQEAHDFKLKFDGFTITSMLRGKKIMKLNGFDDFEYIPGQTVLAPRNTLMRIDFPEAREKKPTQCTALVIDNRYLTEKLNLINATSKTCEERKEWSLDIHELILKNNTELARISNRLLRIFTSNDPFKEYQVDLVLREMVLCTLRLQNLNLIKKDSQLNSNKSAFHSVINYIKDRITDDIKIEELCRVACMSKSSFYRAFADEYGITPVQLILEERLHFAKELMRHHSDISIKEVAYASGFNDPNYFSRMFRKSEGKTPKAFKDEVDGL